MENFKGKSFNRYNMEFYRPEYCWIRARFSRCHLLMGSFLWPLSLQNLAYATPSAFEIISFAFRYNYLSDFRNYNQVLPWNYQTSFDDKSGYQYNYYHVFSSTFLELK